jgi:opacity protein-like surface antigen
MFRVGGRSLLHSRIGVLLVALVSVLATGTAKADDWLAASHRVGRFELFGEGAFYKGNDVDVSGSSGQITLGNNWNAGLGFGMNFGPLFNFNAEIFGGPLDISVGNHFSSSSADNALMAGAMAHIEFYPINGPLTPVLTGGAGFVRTQGDIGTTTFGETDLAFDAGAGVRWDFDEHTFAKVLYRARWIDFKDTEEFMLLHSVWVSFGFKF